LKYKIALIEAGGAVCELEAASVLLSTEGFKNELISEGSEIYWLN
jgi:hypothetical protein